MVCEPSGERKRPVRPTLASQRLPCHRDADLKVVDRVGPGQHACDHARGPGVGVRRRDAPTLLGRKKCSPPRSSAVAWHLLSRHA